MKGSPPILLVRVELEERPRVIVDAESFEDENRLRAWLARPAARRRLLDALAARIDELARGQA